MVQPCPSVSVVVRRMYYWDKLNAPKLGFSLVSVVVRRMYYWDNLFTIRAERRLARFSSC